MQSLLIATRNRHKTSEIRAVLGPEFHLLTLEDFPPAPVIVEDAGSFAGNARKKAVELAAWLASRLPVPEFARITPGSDGIFVVADDSGLEVDALGGAPGIHSARFAALDAGGLGNSPDAANNAKLLRLLAGVPIEKRAARFRCVIALTPVPDSSPEAKSVQAPRESHAIPHSHPPPTPARLDALVSRLHSSTRLFEGVCEGRIGYAPSGQVGFGYDPLFIPTGHDQTFAELGEFIKNRISHRARALALLKQYLAFTPQTLGG
ncbi:MAG: non-canonical purine NTP pyrophosphatase [Candidatus Omnitrophica bacterium]|nr:non-canonical purine NTP pyrophosphatase [Candidatus Omnitrophota bacterium]